MNSERKRLVQQTTASPEATTEVGEYFGSTFLRPGMVVALRGEMGAGKTHFVKGVAASLGIDERTLTSPTFALVNEYEAIRKEGLFLLYHLDCYRFTKPEELLELGVEDYLQPKIGATIIEWPERIEQYLPNRRTEITIEVISESERSITIESL